MRKKKQKKETSLRTRIFTIAITGALFFSVVTMAISLYITYSYALGRLDDSMCDMVSDIAEVIVDEGEPRLEDDYLYLGVVILDEEGNVLEGEPLEQLDGLPFEEGYHETGPFGNYHYYDQKVCNKDGEVFCIRGMLNHADFAFNLFFDSLECDMEGRYPETLRKTRKVAGQCEEIADSAHIPEWMLWYKDGIWFTLRDADDNILAGRFPKAFKEPDMDAFDPLLVDDVFKDWLLYTVPVTLQSGETLYLHACTELAIFANDVQKCVCGFMICIPVLFLLMVGCIYRLMNYYAQPVRGMVQEVRSLRKGQDLSARISEDGRIKEMNDLARIINHMLERMEKAFERETRFTSDVSHELRNPLAVIVTNSEYALDELEMSEEVREEMTAIHDKSVYLSELVNTLLTMARMEQNRYEMHPEDIELNALCCNLAEEYAENGNAKKITVTAEPAKQDVVIHADMVPMIQSISNLVNNAINYGRENGYVKIRVSENGEYARVSVEDNGIGISQEDIDRIWNRFFRADESRGKTVGYGLGLNFVKSAMEMHGGHVEVISTLGEGSTFTLVIPKVPVFDNK